MPRIRQHELVPLAHQHRIEHTCIWHPACNPRCLWPLVRQFGNTGLLCRSAVKQASGDSMLSRCVNLQCGKPFLCLGQGRLFVVEADVITTSPEVKAARSPYLRIPPRRIERYWLCDHCAEVWTLAHDRRRGIALVPLRRPPRSVAAGISNAQRGDFKSG